MKRSVTALFIILFASVFSFCQEGYLIKGKIKGWRDTVCYLGKYYGKGNYLTDTTKTDKDGNFVFKGKDKLPGGIYLIISPRKNSWLELLMDKEQNVSFEADTAQLLESMKVKGSEENVMWYKYQNFVIQKRKNADTKNKRIQKISKDSLAAATTKKDSLRILKEQVTAIDKEVEKYKQDFIDKHPDLFMTAILKAQKDPVVPENPNKKDSLFTYRYYKDHYWDNLPLNDDRLLRTPLFDMRLKRFFETAVILNPDSINKEADRLIEMTKGNKETFKYIVWYMTSNYENHPIMGMDAVFVHEVEQNYVTGKAYWVDSVNLDKIIHQMKLLRPLLMGKPAPAITLQDSLDRNIPLYDVRSKYTLLIFWDPDCGHCQKVLPKLKATYDSTLKAKGVMVYGVNIDDKDDKWKKYIEDNKLQWINVRDKYKQYFLHDLYDVNSTPVVYLLDENKIIKAKRIDVEKLSGYIDFLERQKQRTVTH